MATNYHHADSQQWRGKRRQPITIPGFECGTLEIKIPREPFKFGDLVIDRQPCIRIVTVFTAMIRGYDFSIQHWEGRWTAFSAGRPGWSRQFDLPEPVSNFYALLDTVATVWAFEDMLEPPQIDDWLTSEMAVSI